MRVFDLVVMVDMCERHTAGSDGGARCLGNDGWLRIGTLSFMIVFKMVLPDKAVRSGLSIRAVVGGDVAFLSVSTAGIIAKTSKIFMGSIKNPVVPVRDGLWWRAGMGGEGGHLTTTTDVLLNRGSA